ncbi:MAG: polymer-forming cytoskeletal protein [Ardenticatenaceae bacterium]|nr:polymer-forming cytoskeletal protein [Ardenticatenaceae bacterium]
MAASSEIPTPNGRRRFSLFGKKSEQYIVEGYEIGAIHTSYAVVVPSNSAVAGDIIGETIRVTGQVFGNLMAREIAIEANGIVWGDLFAQKISVEPGGTIRGWVHTLDHSTLSECLSSGQPPAAGLELDPSLPDDLRQEIEQMRADIPEERLSLLETLIAELATARLARFELEQSFEKRLEVMTAERTAEAEQLQEEVESLQRERVANHQRIGELTANLQQTEEAIERAEELLGEKSQLIDKQEAELNSVLATEEEKIAWRKQLEDENQRLDEDLQTMSRRAEELAERITSLEAALKASNQRAAEQEQALIHWQELAELNEVSAKEARENLEDLQFAVKQNVLLAENLQGEKEKLTKLLESAQTKIIRLEESTADFDQSIVSHERLEQLEDELARKTREVELTKQALVESTAAYSQATRQIKALEEEMGAFQSIGEQRDQWEKYINDLEDQLEIAGLKAVKAEKKMAEVTEEVNQLKTDHAQQQDVVTDLRSQNEELNQAIESYKIEIEGLAEKLDEALSDEHDTQTTVVDHDLIVQQLKKHHLQDLDYLNEQLAAQSQKLAEAQSTLVNEKIEAEAITSALQTKEEEMEQMRNEAIKYIQNLQIELRKREAQVQDLIAYIEREKMKDRRPETRE